MASQRPSSTPKPGPVRAVAIPCPCTTWRLVMGKYYTQPPCCALHPRLLTTAETSGPVRGGAPVSTRKTAACNSDSSCKRVRLVTAAAATVAADGGSGGGTATTAVIAATDGGYGTAKTLPTVEQLRIRRRLSRSHVQPNSDHQTGNGCIRHQLPQQQEGQQQEGQQQEGLQQEGQQKEGQRRRYGPASACEHSGHKHLEPRSRAARRPPGELPLPLPLVRLLQGQQATGPYTKQPERKEREEQAHKQPLQQQHLPWQESAGSGHGQQQKQQVRAPGRREPSHEYRQQQHQKALCALQEEQEQQAHQHSQRPPGTQHQQQAQDLRQHHHHQPRQQVSHGLRQQRRQPPVGKQMPAGVDNDAVRGPADKTTRHDSVARARGALLAFCSACEDGKDTERITASSAPAHAPGLGHVPGWTGQGPIGGSGTNDGRERIARRQEPGLGLSPGPARGDEFSPGAAPGSEMQLTSARVAAELRASGPPGPHPVPGPIAWNTLDHLLCALEWAVRLSPGSGSGRALPAGARSPDPTPDPGPVSGPVLAAQQWVLVLRAATNAAWRPDPRAAGALVALMTRDLPDLLQPRYCGFGLKSLRDFGDPSSRPPGAAGAAGIGAMPAAAAAIAAGQTAAAAPVVVGEGVGLTLQLGLLLAQQPLGSPLRAAGGDVLLRALLRQHLPAALGALAALPAAAAAAAAPWDGYTTRKTAVTGCLDDAVALVSWAVGAEAAAGEPGSGATAAATDVSGGLTAARMPGIKSSSGSAGGLEHGYGYGYGTSARCTLPDQPDLLSPSDWCELARQLASAVEEEARRRRAAAQPELLPPAAAVIAAVIRAAATAADDLVTPGWAWLAGFFAGTMASGTPRSKPKRARDQTAAAPAAGRNADDCSNSSSSHGGGTGGGMVGSSTIARTVAGSRDSGPTAAAAAAAVEQANEGSIPSLEQLADALKALCVLFPEGAWLRARLPPQPSSRTASAAATADTAVRGRVRFAASGGASSGRDQAWVSRPEAGSWQERWLRWWWVTTSRSAICRTARSYDPAVLTLLQVLEPLVLGYDPSRSASAGERHSPGSSGSRGGAGGISDRMAARVPLLRPPHEWLCAVAVAVERCLLGPHASGWGRRHARRLSRRAAAADAAGGWDGGNAAAAGGDAAVGGFGASADTNGGGGSGSCGSAAAVGGGVDAAAASNAAAVWVGRGSEGGAAVASDAAAQQPGSGKEEEAVQGGAGDDGPRELQDVLLAKVRLLCCYATFGMHRIRERRPLAPAVLQELIDSGCLASLPQRELAALLRVHQRMATPLQAEAAPAVVQALVRRPVQTMPPQPQPLPLLEGSAATPTAVATIPVGPTDLPLHPSPGIRPPQPLLLSPTASLPLSSLVDALAGLSTCVRPLPHASAAALAAFVKGHLRGLVLVPEPSGAGRCGGGDDAAWGSSSHGLHYHPHLQLHPQQQQQQQYHQPALRLDLWVCLVRLSARQEAAGRAGGGRSSRVGNPFQGCLEACLPHVQAWVSSCSAGELLQAARPLLAARRLAGGQLRSRGPLPHPTTIPASPTATAVAACAAWSALEAALEPLLAAAGSASGPVSPVALLQLLVDVSFEPREALASGFQAQLLHAISVEVDRTAFMVRAPLASQAPVRASLSAFRPTSGTSPRTAPAPSVLRSENLDPRRLQQQPGYSYSYSYSHQRREPDGGGAGGAASAPQRQHPPPPPASATGAAARAPVLHLSADQVSYAAAAVVRLSHGARFVPLGVLRRLVGGVLAAASRMKPEALSQGLWALAELKVTRLGPGGADLLLQVLSVRLGAFPPEKLPLLAHSLAAIRLRPSSPWMVSYTQLVKAHARRYDMRQVAQLLWAYGQLAPGPPYSKMYYRPPRDLISFLLRRCLRSFRLSAGSDSESARGLRLQRPVRPARTQRQRRHHHHAEQQQQQEHDYQQQQHQRRQQQLQEQQALPGADSTTRDPQQEERRTAGSLPFGRRGVSYRYRRLRPPDAAQLVFGLAGLEARPGGVWMRELYRWSGPRLWSFHCRDLALLLFGLARLEARPPPHWLKRAVSSAISQLPYATGPDAAYLSYGLARLAPGLVPYSFLTTLKEMVPELLRRGAREQAASLGAAFGGGNEAAAVSRRPRRTASAVAAAAAAPQLTAEWAGFLTSSYRQLCGSVRSATAPAAAVSGSLRQGLRLRRPAAAVAAVGRPLPSRGAPPPPPPRNGVRQEVQRGGGQRDPASGSLQPAPAETATSNSAAIATTTTSITTGSSSSTCRGSSSTSGGSSGPSRHALRRVRLRPPLHRGRSAVQWPWRHRVTGAP